MDNNDSELDRNQRKKLVNEAFIISSSGDFKPNKDALNIAELYVDGKIELDEMKSRILSLYKKGGDV